MKIDKTMRPEGPKPVAKTSAVAPAKDVSKAADGTTDKVELSSLKDEVAKLKARIKEIPVVNEDKVARVKKAIDSGTYTADSKAVARSILRNHLADETE
jgi:flagellar biosynthesis anti-sigma factor FlgM